MDYEHHEFWACQHDRTPISMERFNQLLKQWRRQQPPPKLEHLAHWLICYLSPKTIDGLYADYLRWCRDECVTAVSQEHWITQLGLLGFKP